MREPEVEEWLGKGVSRRALLASVAAAGWIPAQAASGPVDSAVTKRHDDAVARYLEGQVTDSASPYCGALPDAYGLHAPGAAAGIASAFAFATLHADSRYRDSADVAARVKLAMGFLGRSQNEAGNIYLPVTNFNSPPDTAFAVTGLASAACVAKRAGNTELLSQFEPFLKKAGGALAVGGVHTPNHRWVVCQALAQINEIFPDPRYQQRINQWMAEGIDIDDDGQYNERSTLTYNAITDRALIVVAHKLGRPALLDPVQRNLESMMFLVHPNYEVVTEISRRQDRGQRGDIGAYWFSYQYMSMHNSSGQFAALARRFASERAALGELLEYPELRGPLPATIPPPEDYEKAFPAVGITRVRRGRTSATVIHRGDSSFFHARRGDAVINAVRFASAFFGKGQFVPTRGERRPQGFILTQSLEGPYYQPFDPPKRVAPEAWNLVRESRPKSNVCRLSQQATITERANGFRLRIQSSGTDNVPLAVEINLREGGRIDGCEAAPQVTDGWLVPTGATATYHLGADTMRIGPGLRAHSYTQVRGAELKLGGPSIYLTGFTPFDHTIEFTWT